jgi:hypothetical protein
MASLREQVLARVAAALSAAAPGGAGVSRSREVSITRAQTPAIVVMARSNALNRMASRVDQNQFDLALEIFVRGDPWDSLADPVDLAAHAVLMTDAPLQLLVSDVRRTSEVFDSQEADQTAGVLTVHYRVTFLTLAADISKPG